MQLLCSHFFQRTGCIYYSGVRGSVYNERLKNYEEGKEKC